MKKICRDLVQFANDRGGNDNVTIVAIRVEEIEPTELPEVPVFTLEGESEALVAVEDEWLKRIRDLQVKQPAPPSGLPAKKKGGPNKLLLILIFVAFAAVAWSMSERS